MEHDTAMKNNFWRYQFPAVFWTLLIFILSSIPNVPAPDLGFDLQDKVEHFLFYGIYGFFLAQAAFRQNALPRIRQSYPRFAAGFGILYGLSDEIHQYFVPGREMDFWDFVADACGVVAGVLYFTYRQKRSGK